MNERDISTEKRIEMIGWISYFMDDPKMKLKLQGTPEDVR